MQRGRRLRSEPSGGAAARLDEREVILVTAGAVRRDDDATIGERRRLEAGAVVLEDELRAAPVRGERMKIEEPLIPMVRERQDRAAIGRPTDHVMDPIGAVGEPAGAAPVRSHDPDRPPLVAAFVRAVRDLVSVWRHAVGADPVGVVAEP